MAAFFEMTDSATNSGRCNIHCPTGCTGGNELVVGTSDFYHPDYRNAFDDIPKVGKLAGRIWDAVPEEPFEVPDLRPPLGFLLPHVREQLLGYHRIARDNR